MKTETCKQTDKSWQRKVLGLVVGGEDGTGFGEGVGPAINEQTLVSFLRFMVILLMEISHLILDNQHSFVCYVVFFDHTSKDIQETCHVTTKI